MIFHREVFDNGHRVHFTSDGTGAVQVECVTCKKLIMYAKTNPPTREELKAALLAHSELAPPVEKPAGEGEELKDGCE